MLNFASSNTIDCQVNPIPSPPCPDSPQQFSELTERDKKSLKKLDIDAHTDVIWLECEEKSHQEHIQPLVRKRLLEDDKGGVLFSYSHFNILEFRMLSESF